MSSTNRPASEVYGELVRPLSLIELPDGSVRMEAGDDSLTLNAGEFEKCASMISSYRHPSSKVYRELVRTAYEPMAARARQQAAECSDPAATGIRDEIAAMRWKSAAHVARLAQSVQPEREAPQGALGLCPQGRSGSLPRWLLGICAVAALGLALARSTRSRGSD